jgi:pSer/pThr/pTyr-binding forkhead associated (FHA) protein/uncharacterized RDD family membrane protein YckC
LANTAKLIVNPTSSTRREILLPRSLLSIGRDPTNDLVLPDAMVSRRHAVIEFRGSQFYIRDCNSSNGSLVNGDRVSERNLRDGDLVAIGTARLLFREEGELEEAGAKVVPHPSAPRFQCPTCRADHRKGDLFCRQCGGPLADDLPPRAVCASCGTAVTLPARFCNACGSQLPAQAGGPPAVPDLERTQPGGESLFPDAPPGRQHTPAHQPAGAAAPAQGSTPASRPPHPASAAAAAASHPPAAASVARPPRPRAVPPRADTFRRDVPSGAERHFDSSEPAGFGERLAAGLVDSALVGLGQLLLVSPIFLYWWARELPLSPLEVPFLPIMLSLVLALLAALLGGVYFVHGWGVRGATPGKRMLQLAVEAEDGRFPIGLSTAVLRLVGYLCSALLLGVGFLMIAVTGRGLHDRMAGTRVVRRARS